MAKRDPGPWSLEDQFKALKNEIQKLWRETRRIGKGFNYGGDVIFTSSGTFTKADYDGLKAVKVRCQGGGGAGGGSGATTSTEISAGGGGGGGAYAESFIPVDSLADIETVTVGAGGVGVLDGNGPNGSDSSFGGWAIAVGGNGGGRGAVVAESAGMHSTAGGDGGAEGLSFGDIVFGGGAGNHSIYIVHASPAGQARGISGLGGSAHLGGGGQSSHVESAASGGNDGRAYGGGGSGAGSGKNSVAGTGGDGAQGVVIVELYF